ncbi:MAG: hypothetical protein RMK89_10355 [Armatimonadota bacterium]|nr:hypothetical protein [Armatimonadota bacterium]MDW8143850.1 hypothetical protein [Armatimonadota bacterium]
MRGFSFSLQSVPFGNWRIFLSSSPNKFGIDEFVINHWLKPVTWMLNFSARQEPHPSTTENYATGFSP